MRTRTELAIYRGLAITAVLGVLGVVLFPSFGGLPVPYATGCLSNVKQLGTGVAIYSGDDDDLAPLGRTAGGTTAVGWAERIYPFVKHEAVYADRLEKGAVLSYAMNANVVGLPRFSALAHPERSALLYEIAGARPGRGGDLHATLRLSPVGDGAAGGLLDSIDLDLDPIVRPATGPLANSGLDPRSEPRHRGKSNFVRADTSAGARLPGDVSAGANARAANDAAAPSGGLRRDLPGIDRPRAEGSAHKSAKSTFSLR